MKIKPLDPNNPIDKAKIDFSNIDILNFKLVKNPKGKLGELCYLVKCRDCRKEWYKPKHTIGEQKCFCSRYLKVNNYDEEYKGISSGYYRHIKFGAKERGISFEISKQDIWDVWVNQNGICALSGITLTIEKHYKYVCKMTASLDRIDSKKSYTKDNIQWVHKDINRMKLNYPNDYFIETCKKIAKHNQ